MLFRSQNALNGTPPDMPRDKLAAHQWGQVSVAAWERIQDNLFRVGTIKKKADAAEFVDTRFGAAANTFDRAKVIALGTAAK